MQPRLTASASGKSNDEIVFELADSILSKFPSKLNIEKAAKFMFQLDSMGRLNSLTTVLQQEVERFNKLITVIKVHKDRPSNPDRKSLSLFIFKNSLDDLKKAIKGLKVMNEQLEKMFNSLINSQVPAMWSRVSYPSLKTLGPWVKDLCLRIAFMDVRLIGLGIRSFSHFLNFSPIFQELDTIRLPNIVLVAWYLFHTGLPYWHSTGSRAQIRLADRRAVV